MFHNIGQPIFVIKFSALICRINPLSIIVFNFDFVVGKIIWDVDPDAHLSAVSSRETDLVCLGEYNFLDVNVVDHIAWQIRRKEDLCWVLAVRYLLEGVGQS